MSVPRIGFGFDAHRFDDAVTGTGVLLAGVLAAGDRSVAATSDGDVLAHAVCDALLGAAGLGDLGELFPSDDPQWFGADSMNLLGDVMSRVAAAGLQVSSVDATVIAERVRVAPVRSQIKANLAAALGLEESAVSVKATTTDGMGFLGHDEGIAATAVAVLTAT